MNELYCQKCQTTNPSHARFCSRCGTPISSHSAEDDDGNISFLADEKDVTTPSEEMLKTLPSKDDTLFPEDLLHTLPGRLNSMSLVDVSAYNNISLMPGDDEYNGKQHGQQRWTEEVDAISSQPTSRLQPDSKQKKEDDDEDNVLPFFLPSQANPSRAAHLQPTPLRAAHRQPAAVRTGHLQPATIHVAHKQPLLQRVLHKRSLNISPVMGGAIVVLVGIVAFLSLLVLRSNAQSPRLPAAQLAQLATINASGAFPGGIVTLQGRQFVPGGTINFASDQQALNALITADAPSSSSAASATMSLASFASSRAQLADQTTVVQPNGTFIAFVHIPEDWQVGTNHTIRANEQVSGKSAYGVVTVTVQAASITPAPAPGSSQPANQPTPQPQPAGVAQSPAQNSAQVIPTFTKDAQDNPPPSNPAQNNPSANNSSQGNQTSHSPTPVCLGVDKTQLTFRTDTPENAPDAQILTINNDSECDSGKWYARADVPWLRAEAGQRTIDAGGSVQVKLSVSPDDFKDGINTVGHITFEPGDATVIVRLIVAPRTPCLIQVTDGLQFTLTDGNNISSSPESQKALVGNGSNCGSSQWKVSSDKPWLLVKGGGQIDAGQIVGGKVSVNPNALPARGDESFSQYTNRISGTVTFQAGDSYVGVKVKLLMPPRKNLPPCLDLQTHQLDFTGDLRNNAYYDAPRKDISVINCGDPGTITATSANQGADWLSTSGGGILSTGEELSIGVRAVHPDSGYSPLLEGKDYPGTVTITITTSDGRSQDAHVHVMYHVKDTRPPCPSIDSSSLTFGALVNGNAPDAQRIKVSNACGNGNWSITSKAPWLSVNPGNGILNSGGSVDVSVSASNAGIREQTQKTEYLVLNPGGITVSVTLNVKQPEQATCLTATPTALSFTQNTDKTITPGAQTISIANGPNCAAGKWSATLDSPNWLNVTGGGQIGKDGSDKATVSVKNIQSTTTGHIVLNPGNIVIPVTLTVQQPTKAICLSVPASQLSFTVGVTGSVTPGPQNVSVINGADCAAGTWAATSDSPSWLSVTGSGQIAGDGTGSMSIAAHAPPQPDSADTQPPAPLEGHINVKVGGNTQATIKVTLTFATQPVTPTPGITPTPVVTPTPIVTPTPGITPTVGTAVCPTVNASALTFNAVQGGAAPSAQSLTLSNGRGCSAGGWSAKSDAAWLGMSPGSGTLAANGSASLSINTSIANLAPGRYMGHISFSPGQAVVTVTLNITSSVTPTPVPTATVPPPTPTPAATATAPPPAQTCLTAVSGAINVTLKPGTQTTQNAAAKNGANCAAGQWTSGSDSSWIAASSSGQVAAGGSASVDARITTTGLTPGKTYQGNVVFASGSSKAVIPVTLTITQPVVTPTIAPQPTKAPVPVQPTPTPVPVLRPTVAPQPTKAPIPVQPTPTPVPAFKTCVTAAPAYLAFVVTAQAGNPGTQVITLSNCGSPGTITLRSTNKWLTATGGGFVGAGTNTAITIQAVNINQAGTYSGTITATVTTSDGRVASAVIGVTLKVKGSHPSPQPTQPLAQQVMPTPLKEPT